MHLDDNTVQKYREAGRVAKEALEYGRNLVREGANLFEVAEDIEQFIFKKGARPAFPVNLAVNDAAAHFTPRHDEETKFSKGELVKLDVGTHVDGHIGDTACTVEVSTRNWQDMIKATEDSLHVAIESLGPGILLASIGERIDETISTYGFKAISNLTGHSMKQWTLHSGKTVPNVPESSMERAEVGDVLAIEPFATNGAGRVDGTKSGNIYRLIRLRSSTMNTKPRIAKLLGTGKPIDETGAFLDTIQYEFRTLPFAERWCSRFEKNSHVELQKLLGRGIIATYPVLKDIRKGMVAQSEHTVIVTESGCEVIT